MKEEEINKEVKKAWDNMSRFRKARSFLKMDHYIIGQVTLMDITICITTFFAVGAVLACKTQLEAPIVIFILFLLCSIILFFRIRYRPHKNAAYMYKRLQTAMKQLKKAERNEKDPAMQAQIQDAIEKMNAALTSMEEYIEALIEYRKGEDF